MFSLTKKQLKLTRAVCVLSTGVFSVSLILVFASGGYEVLYALLLMILGGTALGLLYLSYVFRTKSTGKSAMCAMAALFMPGLADFLYHDFETEALISCILLVLPMLAVSMIHRLLGNHFANGAKKALLAGALSCILIVAAHICMHFEPDMFFALWIAQSLIWSYALNLPDNEGTEKRRLTQWGLCLVCLGLICAYIVTDPYYFAMHLRYMYTAFLLCQPFIYTWIFRKLEKKIMRDGSGRFAVVTVGYFGSALLLYLLWAGCFAGFANGYYFKPDAGIYYILMALVVYAGETSHIRGKANHWGLSLLSGIVYICGCAGIIFLGSERLRQIVFMLGGPAVNIAKSDRIDYLGYRLASLRSFFAGNTDEILAFSAKHPTEHVEAYTSYIDSCGLGGAIFRMGWWWLLILIALILVIVWMLSRIRYEDAGKNRIKNYLIISYLIRVVMASVLFVFMFESGLVPFPFAFDAGIDVMILCLLLVF